MSHSRSPFAPMTWLPKGAWTLLREVGRHLLKRPVVGICAVARDAEGRVLLVRRGDSGGWALPGGTLEWGETLVDALPRELEEEAGATVVGPATVTGVYSRPDRDPRFHAVTICVTCAIEGPVRGPKNRLEIWEAKLFEPHEVPTELALTMHDMLRDAQQANGVVLE